MLSPQSQQLSQFCSDFHSNTEDQKEEKEHCLLSNYLEHVGTGLLVPMSKILVFIITCALRHAVIYGVKEPAARIKRQQALIIFLGL